MASQEMVKESSSSELQSPERAEPHWLTPAVDIYENEREYVLFADLPGADTESVNIQIDASELRIQAKVANGDDRALVYARTFQVGPSIDPTKVSAEMKHGVLKLIAKKSDTHTPRQIKIKAS